MRKHKFSLKLYLRETFLDERKRKPFLVGLIVFIIVFIGLTIYQQTIKEQGDVIISGDHAGVGPAETEQVTDLDSEANSGQSEEPDKNGGSDGNGINSDTEPIAIFVDIGGAVNISGMFALPPGSRVDDAIKIAGGLKEDADMRYLNRAAVLNDGDRLYIPTESEVLSGNVPPSAGQVTSNGGYYGNASAGQSGSDNNSGSGNNNNSGSGNSQTQNLININTANSEELQKLNGVGPVTAQKIIDYRTNRGAFKRIEELMNVSGIGAKTFEKLRNYITV